jgi:hypothetical protein
MQCPHRHHNDDGVHNEDHDPDDEHVADPDCVCVTNASTCQHQCP